MSRTRRFGTRSRETPSSADVEETTAVIPEQRPAVAAPATADDAEEIASVMPTAPDDLDPDHVPYWDVWAGPIGHAVRPMLEELEVSVPTLTAAIALTPSGRAICSVGLDEAASTRTAAMVSNMVALGGAAVAISTGGDEDQAATDVITLTHGEQRAVALVVDDIIVDRLLLWVAATEVNLGVLTFQAKSAAEKIAKILEDRDEPAPQTQHPHLAAAANHTNTGERT